MRKIPTLFVRDETDRRRVTRDVTPGCEWVLDGEGRATRKYDGTCVLVYRDGVASVRVATRREVKPGKPKPEGFLEVEHDEATGKTVGWEPSANSGFAQALVEALQNTDLTSLLSGTYELVGPKVNGNPEAYDTHVLVRHGNYPLPDAPRDYDGLAEWLAAHEFEGIVWHHPDGRMAKLKKRDLLVTG